MSKTLVIVGAGPKAAALVARAAVLIEMGVPNVPTLYVFEKEAIGSAWSGSSGYSSGHLTLCSPAEKDVGFPYAEISLPDTEPLLGHVSRPIGPELYARFSWSAYLVATGGFSEWVDRGRDHPNHATWAKYLQWVLKKARANIIKAEVLKIVPQSRGGWNITYRVDKEEDVAYADGVVLTGTGKAATIKHLSETIPPERLFDAESFWAARNDVLHMNQIAVIGGGGAAGAIIAWLSNALAERKDGVVHSISTMGTLFSRGDGYAERRWFSDPTDWRDLSVEDRRKLIERTEAGVISARNKSIIDGARNVHYVQGRAAGASWDGSELKIDLMYGDKTLVPLKAECMINAIGFDAWSLLDIVNAASIATWDKNKKRELEEAMMENLSFSSGAGLGAGLHVPAIAALSCGPGMSTLGSLGLLASAILDGYL